MLLLALALGGSGRVPLLAAVAGAGALHAGAMAVQRFVTWPDALRRAEKIGLSPSEIARLETLRPMGLSLSPDLAGALALCGLAASFALLVALPRRFCIPLGVAAALCGLGAVLSRSHGVWLAAIVFALLFVDAPLFLRVERRGLRALFGAGMAVAGTLLGLFVVGRGAGALLLSATERLLNWKVALAAFVHDPLFGVGVGRFVAAYAFHRVPEANVTRYAHSLPFHALAETGVLGVGAGAVLLGLFFFSLLRAWRARGRPLSTTERVVLAGAIALFFHSLYDYDVQVAQTATALAALLGIAWQDAYAALDEGAPRRGARPLALAVFGLLALGPALLLPTLVFREAALEPFSRGSGPPTEEDAVRLFAYLEDHPRDDHALVVVLRMELAAALACDSACDELWRPPRARAKARLERPHPPPDAFYVAALLAALDGELTEAHQVVRRGLEEDSGSSALHALRIRVAEARGDPRIGLYRDEALRWVRAEELEEAKRRVPTLR